MSLEANQDKPIEEKADRFCSIGSCVRAGFDYVKVVLVPNDGLTGSMEVEFLACEMHCMSLEMGSAGTYLLVRRQRV